MWLGHSNMPLGRLRFHNDNECENDNEISLLVLLHFCTQRDERPIASISLSTTTIPNRNPGRTQEMMMSAHKKIRFRTRCRSEIVTSLLYGCLFRNRIIHFLVLQNTGTICYKRIYYIACKKYRKKSIHFKLHLYRDWTSHGITAWPVGCRAPRENTYRIVDTHDGAFTFNSFS